MGRGCSLLDTGQVKNAAAIDGVRTRSSRLAPGQVLTLGNTLLVLDQQLACEPCDLDASALPALRPELTAFDREPAA